MPIDMSRFGVLASNLARFLVKRSGIPVLSYIREERSLEVKDLQQMINWLAEDMKYKLTNGELQSE